MNEWFYRAVDAVDDAEPEIDPETLRGLVADLFTPTGGQAREDFAGSLPLSGDGDGAVGTLIIDVPLLDILTGLVPMESDAAA